MTAIAALIDNGKCYIGGDSAGISPDYTLTTRKDEKVFENRGLLIGFTSSFRLGSLLRFSFRPPTQAKTISDVEYMNTVFIDAVRRCFRDGGFMTVSENVETGGTFIIGYKGALYEVIDDFQVAIPADNYIACGCGRDLVMGSLYSTQGLEPEARIRKALEAAEHFSGGVRGPFIIKSI